MSVCKDESVARGTHGSPEGLMGPLGNEVEPGEEGKGVSWGHT